MYVSVTVDKSKCTGCKLCVFTCPDPNVIYVTADKKVAVNDSRCKGCGLCVSVCPEEALEIGHPAKT